MIGQKLKPAPPTGGHVFQMIGTTFELNHDIIKTNILTNFELGRDFIGTKLLTKFHEDGTRNVASRTDRHTTDKDRSQKLTCAIRKLPPSSHKTNVLTKFHENRAKNVTSREFTCFHYIHIEKNAPPTGGHVFSPIWTIFELFGDINKTNVLTNFHDDWAIIENCSPTGGHVFQQTRTTFELDQHIIKTNILTNLELNRDIIWTNVLTKFHENRTQDMASRVFTRKTAPPTGGHVFQRTRTTFELNQHIIKTNILTKLHEDWA
ncbi:hypothetical protein DPMN_010694 [Dreissena polymorpha]|uniref:Uncharacterized protein n=1 Tax=Dreissena polymorpha TaxID=45954 RepID=A0A9D4RZH6_DREPO|nr:hypothetical protein DPMN_010694 [Dreissena polymorpha]